MKYSAHGLLFESEVDLTPLQSYETDQSPQARIIYTRVSASGLAEPKLIRPYTQADENRIWIDVPNIARYEITDGKTIHVDPYPQADPQSVRLYLLGSAIGAILHQRGNLVLHANAIKVGDGLVIFAGDSGAGKSTTAAVFHQRGYQVISDDVIAINQHCFALGGFPQIKLWKDTLNKLGIKPDDLNKIRAEVNKYSFPIQKDYVDQPLPIRAIYILDLAHHKKKLEFEHSILKGMEKFNALKQFTYRKNMIGGMGLRPKHLKLCATLAGQTPMSLITRPNGHFSAQELVDTVIEDLKRQGIFSPPNTI